MALITLARLAFQRQMAYRVANVAGLITNAFFGLLRGAVLIALFNAQANPVVAGYRVEDALTFAALTQAVLAYIGLWGWLDVIRNVRSGDIATDLARPISFFWYWWAQDMGRALGQLLMRGLPIMLFFALVYPVHWPASLAQWLLFVISMALALFVSFAWRFLVSLSAFWTQDAMGVMRMSMGVVTILSGFTLPISFFPDWAARLMQLLPFAGMVNTPIEIFAGVLQGELLFVRLAMQAFWGIALLLLAQWVLSQGVRKLVIQGG